jgi:hypothetical protein
VPPHGRYFEHENVQIGEEPVDEQQKAANQAQQKRRHQPTAEKDHRLNATPGRLPHGTSLVICGSNSARAPAMQSIQFAARSTALGEAIR